MESIKQIFNASWLFSLVSSCMEFLCKCSLFDGIFLSEKQEKKVNDVLQSSGICRWLFSIADRCSIDWQGSGFVTAFVVPSRVDETVAQHSIFHRLFEQLRGWLVSLYRKLKLEQILSDSILTRSALWAVIAVALAPLIPTMVLFGITLLCFCGVALGLLRNPTVPLAHSPMNRYIILYVVLYLIATLTSASLSSSLFVGGLTIVFILFTLAIQNAITTQEMLDRLIALLVISACVVSVVGVIQAVFGLGYQSGAWVDSSMFGSISFRLSSTLENPNMLGQYLILTIPFAGAKLLTAQSRRDRILYFIACGILVIAMVLTFSRGAWLGLLFAGAIFLVLYNPRILLLLPLLPFVCLVLFFVLPETIITRFTSIGDMSDASTSYRVYIWLGCLDMLKDFWICGIGPGEGAFNMVYPIYGYSAISAPHSHNLFLQIICDAGITSLITFVAVLVQYVRDLCVALRRRDSSESRLLQIASISAVAGFMVQAMTDYSFYNYRVMFLFWAVLGIGALVARRDSLSKEVVRL